MARPRPEPGAASSARTPLCSTASRTSGTIQPWPSSSTRITSGRATRGVCGARRRRRRARPFARVVQQVAEHLVEILALDRGPSRAGHVARRSRARARRAGEAASARGRRPSRARRQRAAASRPTPRRALAPGGSPSAAACARPAERWRAAISVLAGLARRARPPAPGPRAASSARARDRRPWRWRAGSPARDDRAARSDRPRAAGPRRDRRRPTRRSRPSRSRRTVCAGRPTGARPRRTCTQPGDQAEHGASTISDGLCKKPMRRADGDVEVATADESA